MNFEVYCDESRPDLFCSQNPKSRHLLIGSLWLPASYRNRIKSDIQNLREKHDTWGEIKYSKASPSRMLFYQALIDLFISYKLNLRFRCIVVDRSLVNMSLINNDSELGFYKFYYQLLQHWILDFNEYRIFCDLKTSRDPRRLEVLQRCLQYSNLSSDLQDIQALPSSQVVLIQLCDLLLGITSARLNNLLKKDSSKIKLAEHLEEKLEINKISPTPRDAKKFNVFKIQLHGGW